MNATKPWDGYNGQEAILFDHFNGQWPIKMWLELTARQGIYVPGKGGLIFLRRCKRMYFTSLKPCKWWPKVTPAQLLAVEKRITEIHL